MQQKCKDPIREYKRNFCNYKVKKHLPSYDMQAPRGKADISLTPTHSRPRH
jgi:hypothetical protein